MSNPGEADLTPITHTRQLADWFAAGTKPRAHWASARNTRISASTALISPRPPMRNGAGRHPGDAGGAEAKGWAPILDDGNPIGLKRDSASVSLEPAGQLELSGGILPDLHATRQELQQHLREVHEVTGPMGIGFASLGFHPTHTRDEMPWMPKGRYAIMRRYMPTVGRLGLDMMLRTCTVQANLDYGDEADMVEKLRISLALQPVATALFANSPFTEGKPNGFRTMRGAGLDRHRRPAPASRRGVRAGLWLRALCRMGARQCRCISSCATASGWTWRAQLPAFPRRPA